MSVEITENNSDGCTVEIDFASRTVKTAGITSHPDEAWMMQKARNLTDAGEPFLRRARFLIMDRDMKYSAAFCAALGWERVEPMRLSPRSPNLNAYAERFVRSVKTECTWRTAFFSDHRLTVRARTTSWSIMRSAIIRGCRITC
jgi:transposase InsO family protein